MCVPKTNALNALNFIICLQDMSGFGLPVQLLHRRNTHVSMRLHEPVNLDLQDIFFK